MKKLIAVTALTLMCSSAFAQTQPAPGASSEGNVGPGATALRAPMGTTTGMGNGMSQPGTRPSAGDASNSGAPTSAGVNSMGSGTEPGAVKSGANGR